MLKVKKIVYLDLFDDGHHFEHALHLLKYYLSLPDQDRFELSVCVTDKLWSRLQVQLGSTEEVRKIKFIPLNATQKKLFERRNAAKSSRSKLAISSFADIYSIFLLVLKYRQRSFLINVMNNLVVPVLFVRFFLWGVRISGIYFNPLYRSKYAIDENKSRRYRISYEIDNVRLWLFARINSVKKIFILGDKSLTRFFNSRYKTSRFVFIGDPFFNVTPVITEQAALNEKPQLKVLSFGSLQARKGIFIILDAVINMDEALLIRFQFRFLGAVDKADKELVSEKMAIITAMNRQKHVDLVDAFVEYDNLVASIESSDIIYSGYKSYGASSGVLSWAVLFRKPVIAVRRSLVGSLASNCGLSFLMGKYGVQELIAILSEITQTTYKIPNETQSQRFLQENSPQAFAAGIFENILASTHG